MDKKTIFIIILLGLCLTFAYIAFKPAPESINEILIKKLEDSLNLKNKALQAENTRLNERDAQKSKKIDSLQSLKPQIQKIYVKIYDKIDRSTVNDFNIASDSLFTISGIK